ncbi:MAG: ChbG/HpnK family deacetylase [Nitrospirota bacterium]
MDTAPVARKYLVVVADDLGRSSPVNRAIAAAHDRGIVTAASIMAGGAAFEEAVDLVRNRETLSVGLHLTLCDGRAVLPRRRIPGLVDPDGCFERNPAVAWLRCLYRDTDAQIEAEIAAQFDRLEAAGITPEHVDSHHHLHMQPRLFALVCRLAAERGVRWIRIPAEPASMLSKWRSPSRGIMPFLEWGAFAMLAPGNARAARRYGLRSACTVYGLSRTGAVDKAYLFAVVRSMSSSPCELFVHPDEATPGGRKELEALISPEVRHRIDAAGIELGHYESLFGALPASVATGNQWTQR